LGLAHRPPDYVGKIPQRRILEQKASSFSLIMTQTNSMLHWVQQYTEQTVSPCRPPLWRRSSDPSTRDKVCADHEEALILSNLMAQTEWNPTPCMAILRTILRYFEKNTSHKTHCHIGTQHGDGGAGTPGRARGSGRSVGGRLKVWGHKKDSSKRLPNEPITFL
jgi:hypothetical protein